mmetsp:Transcript_727/g.2402  ORF Transcript_727/g.2402 Transcript_727/m.2402 type:complete len:208 (+) Transcript_727:81-704(+)
MRRLRPPGISHGHSLRRADRNSPPSPVCGPGWSRRSQPEAASASISLWRAGGRAPSGHRNSRRPLLTRYPRGIRPSTRHSRGMRHWRGWKRPSARGGRPPPIIPLPVSTPSPAATIRFGLGVRPTVPPPSSMTHWSPRWLWMLWEHRLPHQRVGCSLSPRPGSPSSWRHPTRHPVTSLLQSRVSSRLCAPEHPACSSRAPPAQARRL